jgi:hypothetical protein
MSEKRNLPGEAEMHRAMNATPEEHAQLREALAELAWGVLVADGLTEAGGRRASIAAHAIVGNQLPLLADVLAERDRLRAAVERVEGLAKYYDSKSEETWRNPSAAISYDFDIIAIQIRDALSAPVPSPEGRDTHTDGSAPTTPPRASQGADAQVTAADREKAAVLFRTARADHNHLRGEEAIAQALADERIQAREPFEQLFAGGPDTSCRTTWPDGIECVEVPITDLRAAFEPRT